ncbi:MAG: hypothetical protein GF384_01470 [Elusimicrobia bacterium]|nr:hypothetical protein [Elusimicrobiota bacterium]MBD3411690.1 hypothetical protein [Elusimicrobiota bacterium]
MLVEKLFLFLPGLLLVCGIGLFTWLFFTLTSRTKNSKSTKNRTDIQAVLNALESAPSAVSLDKLRAFSRAGAFDARHRTPAVPEHMNVYPEPVSIQALHESITALIKEYTNGSHRIIEELHQVRTYPRIDELVLRQDEEKLDQIRRHKQQLLDSLDVLYDRFNNDIETREKEIHELMLQYQHVQMSHPSVRPRNTDLAPDCVAALNNIHEKSKQLKQITQQQRNEIVNEITAVRGQHEQVVSQCRSMIETLQHETQLTTETLNADIERTRKTIEEMNALMPQVVREKQIQKDQIVSAIELMEERLRTEEKIAQERRERLVRHMQFHIGRAEQRLKQEQSSWNKKYALLQEEYALRTAQYEREEEALRRDWESKKAAAQAEKSSLEQELSKLEQAYQDQFAVFNQKKQMQENEIASLYEVLEKNNARYQTRCTELDAQHQADKQRLQVQFAEVQKKLTDGAREYERTQSEHTQRLTVLSQQYKERLNQIEAEGQESMRIMEHAQAHLREQIASEQKRFEFNQQAWSEQEQQLHEEKQQIENQLIKMEKQSIAEQDKQHAAYVMETVELNRQIKELEDQLTRTQADYRAVLEKRNWELECLEVKESRRIEQAKEMWQAQETRFAEDKRMLEQERAMLGSSMEKAARSSEEKRQQLIDTVRGIRKTIAQKQEQADTVMHQRNREYKKLVQPLYDRIKKIQSQLVAEKNSYEPKISECTEQIKTLSLRLAWRDERQQASETRRQKEIEKFKQQLSAEIDTLRNRAGKQSIKLEQMLKPFIEDFERLSADCAQTEQRLHQEKSAYEELKKSRLDIESQINQIQDRLPEQLADYAKLLGLKEKQIKALNREIFQKEKGMDREEIISRDAIQRMRASYKSLKLQADKIIHEKTKEHSDRP